MRAKLCTAIAAACLIAFTARSAAADPTLWVVKGKDSTVYLLGTVHFLNAAQTWRTPAIDKAFRESSELWQEFPLPVTGKGSAPGFRPDESQRMAQLWTTLGTATEGPPLTSRLTPAEAAQLAAYVPVPKERLDRMRPWMAAGLVGAAMLQKLGLSASSGADYRLAEDAVDQGKIVRGFETFEQQMHFFADLTPDEELGYLRYSIDDAAGGMARFEAIQRAWIAGDDAAVTKLVLDQMHTLSPVFYRRFAVERNQRWVSQIEAMLRTPGVRFVDVGDGHMMGPDGVPALLRKDGWRVEKVR